MTYGSFPVNLADVLTYDFDSNIALMISEIVIFIVILTFWADKIVLERKFLVAHN